MVDDDGPGLIDNPQTALACLEREVGILAIGRRIGGIEAVDRPPQGERDGDRRARAIVDILQIAEFRRARMLVAAEVPCRSVAPEYAAGFLQAAVRIDEPGADEPRVGPQAEGFDSLSS